MRRPSEVGLRDSVGGGTVAGMSAETVMQASMPSFPVRVLTACRPWGTPISVVPVLMGAALAVVYGGAPLYWGRLGLTVLAVWLVHSASNMLSDVADFRHGLDRTPLPVSGSVVRGWLSERQTFGLGVLFILIGGVIGAWLASVSGPIPLAVAGVGLALAVAYTALKRVALGDLAVFVAFGPMISLGTWAVFTGSFSWLPFVWMVPFGLVVIAVLHANNWRDIASDRERGVVSVAGLLGDGGSLAYYGTLIFGPFVLLLAMMIVPRVLPGAGWTPMPWTFLLPFLSLRVALKLWGRARRRASPRDPLDFVTLDGATAQFMVPFGVLSVVAVVATSLLPRAF